MTLLFLLLLSVTSFFANLNEIVQAARQPQKFAVIENFFISLYKGTSNKLIWQYRVKNEIVKYWRETRNDERPTIRERCSWKSPFEVDEEG